MADVFECLERLVEAGKIRSYGLSNVNAADLPEGELPAALACFQMECSLVRRDHEAEIGSLQARGLTFLSWGSLGQGVLSGKYGADAVFDGEDRRSRDAYGHFHGTGLARSMRVVATMREIASATGLTLPQIAVRWILDRYPGAVALQGIKRSIQIEEAAGALGDALDDEYLDQLDEVSSNCEE